MRIHAVQHGYFGDLVWQIQIKSMVCLFVCFSIAFEVFCFFYRTLVWWLCCECFCVCVLYKDNTYEMCLFIYLFVSFPRLIHCDQRWVDFRMRHLSETFFSLFIPSVFIRTQCVWISLKIIIYDQHTYTLAQLEHFFSALISVFISTVRRFVCKFHYLGSTRHIQNNIFAVHCDAWMLNGFCFDQ